MTGRLQGKVALVTGTGSGIGRAIAERFIAEGARVVAVDISGNQIAVAEKLGSNCIPVQADVSKSADVQAMLAAAVSKFGGLHVLCNNAAIEGHMAPVGEYPEAEWDKVIAINLRSVFLGMRYGIPLMLKNGGGSIVNTASMAAMVAFPNMAAYCAAKGGVKQLTKTAAVEYASKGPIRSSVSLSRWRLLILRCSWPAMSHRSSPAPRSPSTVGTRPFESEDRRSPARLRSKRNEKKPMITAPTNTMD